MDLKNEKVKKKLKKTIGFYDDHKITKKQLKFKYGIVPPFSVLDARQGDWQAKKAEWVAKGIKSELGRGEMNPGSPGDTRHDPAATYQKKKSKRLTWNIDIDGQSHGKKKGKKYGKTYGTEDNIAGKQTGTSIFDPVLCELMYNWFCPKGGHILDPFAGGSVRGIVAGCMGHKYTGIDLSEAQIKANRVQEKEILDGNNVRWIVGDSCDVVQLAYKGYDMIFSCPPYYNLEVYGDDPKDLSNADGYGDFLESYRNIIENSLMLLKNNRFACFVVSNIRDKEGFYYDLVGDTVDGFKNGGARFYNDMVLVTSVGSLPIRVDKQMDISRKIGKTHQNVLVFYKGNPKKIKELV